MDLTRQCRNDRGGRGRTPKICRSGVRAPRSSVGLSADQESALNEEFQL